MDIQIENRPRTDPAALVAEYAIFVDAGYIADNPQRRVLAYDQYPTSEFVVAAIDGEIIGVSRIIWSDPNRAPYHFPTLNDFPDIRQAAIDEIRSFPSEKLCEFGTIGIRRSFRGRRILTQMVNHFIAQGLAQDMELCLASIDETLFKLLKKVGFPPEPIGDARFYMGSMTIPSLFRAADYR